MRYLTLGEVLELHRRVIEQSGGADGIRIGRLASCSNVVGLMYDGDGNSPRWLFRITRFVLSDFRRSSCNTVE